MAQAKQDTSLILTRLSVHRAGYGAYSWQKSDPNAPFAATVELAGANGKVELNLSEALSRRIVEIVADEVAKAGRATAEAMVADALLVSQPKAAITSRASV